MVHGLETIKAINAEAVANKATTFSDVEKQKLVDAIDLATDWLQLQQDDYEAMQDAMPSDSERNTVLGGSYERSRATIKGDQFRSGKTAERLDGIDRL